MSAPQKFMVFSPLAAGMAAIAVMLLLFVYLFVFGSLLGLNVSSLDDNGPQWPFATMWYLGWFALIAVPLGAVWAAVSLKRLRRGDR